jgi:hypothetical protein
MFTLYPVGIKKPSLDVLWNAMHAGESIETHRCELCQQVGSTTIFKATTHAPEILIFFLQRGKFNRNTGQKMVDMKLVTPIDMSLPFTSTFPFVSDDAPAGVSALAKAGCRHTAAASFDFKSCAVKTTTGMWDHYVNVRKIGLHHFVKIDDHKVKKISEKDQLKAANKAILVLYDVQDASKGRLAPCP